MILNLANNKVGGRIPTGVGSLQHLEILSLRSNRFSGSIPNSVFNSQTLQILDLSDNNLSGHIPKKLGNWSGLTRNSNLHGFVNYPHFGLQMVIKGVMIKIKDLYKYSTSIDLSCNNLGGNIPKEIGLLTLLFSLNLSHNQFSGDIPESIANLSGLESLDLRSNKLSGHIPNTLALIDTLAVLNLSSNKLSGKVPRSPHFDTLSLDGSAFSGNELLCGFPTKKLCNGDTNTSIGDVIVDEVDPEDAKEKMLLYAIVALGFVLGFWGLYLILFLKRNQWWFPYWKMVDSVTVRIIGYIQNK
ncbi:hypothetical protein MKW92_012532 [Papaver armeniacum]|nr:hypothetical protein MKW92_012532 [Papaver armeniacum]